MKLKTYAGPVIFSIVGVVIAIAIFVVAVITIANEEVNEYPIDNSNNIIVLDSFGSAVVHLSTIYDYEIVDIGNNTILIETLFEGEYGTYEVIFEADDEMMLEMVVFESLMDDGTGRYMLGTLTATQAGTVEVYVNHMDGLGEFPPVLLIEESPVGIDSVMLIVATLVVGGITVLGAFIYFMLVRSSRQRYFASNGQIMGYKRTTLNEVDQNVDFESYDMYGVNNKEVKYMSQPEQRQTYYLSPLEVLIDTDKNFNEESQTNKELAWIKYTADFVTMGTSKDNPFIRGKEETINSIMKLYQMENLSFKWKPKFGYVSDDGTLGVTVGLYKRSYTVEEETIEERGKYISVWRYINGMWKIIYDMGN